MNTCTIRLSDMVGISWQGPGEIVQIVTVHVLSEARLDSTFCTPQSPIKGGGDFFRAFINSELGLPEVARPHVWPELLVEFLQFLDIGAEPAQSHTPPKYGTRNSHISQMVLGGQDGYQTVRLVLLINLIYLYMGLR